MQTVTVENNKVVINHGDSKAIFPLGFIRKRIKELSLDLDKFKEYERLLTPDTPALQFIYAFDTAFSLIDTYIKEYPHCICSKIHMLLGKNALDCFHCNNINLFNEMSSWKYQYKTLTQPSANE